MPSEEIGVGGRGDIVENVNVDIDDEIQEDIDRGASYNHAAASQIQTSIAKLENSSVEIAEEASVQTDQITNIKQAVDDLVEDVQEATTDT